MISTRTLLVASLAALAALASAGCGTGAATVTGEVTYEGQPVGDGTITLTPEDGKGPKVGGTSTAGRYTVPGVLPGPKIAHVEAYKRVNFASSSEEMMKKAAEAKRRGDDSGLVDAADVIPANAEGNGRRVDVKPGANTFDFRLMRPAAGKK